MRGFPGGSMVKNLPANSGDSSSSPGSGRSPGEGNGNPFQYSCLENPMDRGTWQASPWGCKESNIREYTFRLYMRYICISNKNPKQMFLERQIQGHENIWDISLIQKSFHVEYSRFSLFVKLCSISHRRP